jgi:chemotaxis protein MotB
MTHSHSRSRNPKRPYAHRRSRDRAVAAGSMLSGIARPLWPVLALAFAVVLSGCVMTGEHNEVVSQRDDLASGKKRLEEKVRLLEASNKALTDELDASLEQYEDLDVAREGLVTKVASLETKEAELAASLTETTTELVSSQEKLGKAKTEVERLTSTYTDLMSDLEAEVTSGQIEIEQLREGIRLNVSDEILFKSGSANLDPVGKKVLLKVVGQLKGLEHNIEVQGHTDDRRIRGGLAKRYPTNWELASARASRVVRLMEEGGVSGVRLRVVSLASFQPMASNDTAEGRSLNRRIEIRLLPQQRDALSGDPPDAQQADTAVGSEAKSEPGSGS